MVIAMVADDTMT